MQKNVFLEFRNCSISIDYLVSGVGPEAGEKSIISKLAIFRIFRSIRDLEEIQSQHPIGN